MTIEVSAPTDLSAVNRMLASVGQAPITSIDTQEVTINGVITEVQTNPEVAIAINTLAEVSREVQSMGWTFNTEYNVVYNPDPVRNNRIQVPFNVLQMDASTNIPSQRGMDTIRKNGFIWDKIAQTDSFTGPIQFDLIFMMDWNDMPIPIQDYVVAKASALFSQRVIGDPQQYALLEQKANECSIYALEYETSQGDYTFFGQPRSGNFYFSYEPFHALQR